MGAVSLWEDIRDKIEAGIEEAKTYRRRWSSLTEADFRYLFGRSQAILKDAKVLYIEAKKEVRRLTLESTRLKRQISDLETERNNLWRELDTSRKKRHNLRIENDNLRTEQSVGRRR